MSPRVGNVFFDCCSLSNFAAVQRLDLLEKRYGYRARWTDAVQFEVQRSMNVVPNLKDVLDAEWLTMVEVSGDRTALREIDRIRRGLSLGVPPDNPLQHLGEAQTIYYLETHEPSGILVTDDLAAFDFAKRRGLSAIDSPYVLAYCFANDEIGCPDAYNLLTEMYKRGRHGVRVPASHREVCP